MEEQQEELVENEELLRAFYFEVLGTLRHVIGNIWTNAKFFATLSVGLLTICLASINAVAKAAVSIPPSLTAILLSLVPLLIIAVAFVGRANLRREYTRYLEFVVIAIKLQEKLGFQRITTFKRFRDDKYLLPPRFEEDAFKTSEEFVALNLARRDSLYYYFRSLQDMFAFFGLILLGGSWWAAYS